MDMDMWYAAFVAKNELPQSCWTFAELPQLVKAKLQEAFDADIAPNEFEYSDSE